MGSVGHISESSSGTDDENSWSSEEETFSLKPKLSGDQINVVETLMTFFWNIMNKSWGNDVRKRTQRAGDTFSSSAGGSSQRLSSGTSNVVVPLQINLRKRPVNDDEKDNEDRPNKHRRNTPNDLVDPLEKIKLSCPYRKQNRRKYNVHTYRTCALSSFPDIARVKYELQFLHYHKQRR